MTEIQESININHSTNNSQVLAQLGIEVEKEAPEPSFIMLDLTPTLAGLLLSINMRNRNITPNQVNLHRSQMMKGEYYGTLEPIKIDWNGELIDGQHRLMALKQCPDNTIIKFAIVYNCPPDSRYVIDTGKKRSASDTLQILGYSNAKDIPSIIMGTFLGQRLSFKTKAAMKEACCPYDYHKVHTAMTVKDIEAMYLKHREALDFVLGTFKKYPGNNPPSKSAVIKSVLVRAYYHENHEQLQEFVNVYQTGLASPSISIEESNTALTFRNLLSSESQHERKTKQKKTAYNVIKSRAIATNTYILYSITERAVKAFCDKENIFRLLPTKHELYPVPDFDKVNLSNKHSFLKPSTTKSDEVEAKEDTI